MDKTYQVPQGRLLSSFVLVVFALVIFYAGFLFMQKLSLNKELDQISSDTVEVQTQIEILKDEQIEAFAIAQETVDLVEEERVLWSKVVRKLQDLAPVSVFFSSYSGGSDGSLQVSAVGSDFGSVSDTLSALSISSDFENAFVPSVTKGSTSEGQEVVSFSLSVDANLE